MLSNDEMDVTPAYTTEAQLTDDAFTLLEDDKHVWPPYNVAPVVRAEVLDAHPQIEAALKRVNDAFTTEEAHPPERPGGHRQGGVRGRGPRPGPLFESIG